MSLYYQGVEYEVAIASVPTTPAPAAANYPGLSYYTYPSSEVPAFSLVTFQ